jgi:hypothetical protein
MGNDPEVERLREALRQIASEENTYLQSVRIAKDALEASNGSSMTQSPSPQSQDAAVVDVNTALQAVDTLYDMTQSLSTAGERIDAKIALKRQIIALATASLAAPQEEPAASADTVPWPVVAGYSGGGSPEGLRARVMIRFGDGPEEVEYVPASPVNAPERDAALRLIMQMADRAKEPCGEDPESAAAVRNGKFATIAHVAAQGLGLTRGPSLSDAVNAAGDKETK